MGKDYFFELTAKACLLFFVVAFFLYPISAILLRAFESGSEVDLFAVISANTGIVFASAVQASASAIFAILIGFPAAFLVARREFPGRKLLRSISLIPFVFPSVLVVLSFVIVLGNNGWVNTLLRSVFGFAEPVQFLYGFWGVVLAHAFYNFPIVMRFVSDSWERIDSQMDGAAQTLGAGKFQRFLRITLPQLLPSLAAAATLVFIYCFMSFAIVISLGGMQLSTLEVQIYQQITRNLDFASAASLSMLQFVLLAGLGLVYFFFIRKFAIPNSSGQIERKRLDVSTFGGLSGAIFLCAVAFFVLIPLLSLIVFAFFDTRTGALSLRAFTKIFSAGPSLSGATALSSIFYSLAIASIASAVATLTGLLASLRQTRVPFAAALLGSSLAVSIITLGFGYLLGFGSGSLFIIALGHSALAFPFAYRLCSNALSKIGEDSIDAARVMGAGSVEIFRKIQLPQIKGALFSSLAFSFAVSLGELGLVLVLYDGIYPTMPVYIYRLISVFDIGAATAMGLILVGVSFFCFAVIEHFSRDVSVF